MRLPERSVMFARAAMLPSASFFTLTQHPYDICSPLPFVSPASSLSTTAVTACMALANVIKSSLGPTGLDKMLVRGRVRNVWGQRQFVCV